MRAIILSLIFSIVGFASDCDYKFTLTAAHPTVTINNKGLACFTWQVTHFVNGFSAASVQFESASDVNGVPGVFSAFAGTLVSGANPNSSVTQATSLYQGAYPWIQIELVSQTGTGSVAGRILGAQATSAILNTPFISNPLFPGKIFSPKDSDFSWVDQGTATEFAGNDGLFLRAPLNSADTNLNKRCAALPLAPWTVTALFQYPVTPLSIQTGLALQQTGNAITTEILNVNAQANAGANLVRQLAQCTAGTVASCNQNVANDGQGFALGGSVVFWARVWDDGVANRNYETSVDGLNWTPLHNMSASRGEVAYGTIVPNQACWTINQANNDVMFEYKLSSWKICPTAGVSAC